MTSESSTTNNNPTVDDDLPKVVSDFEYRYIIPQG